MQGERRRNAAALVARKACRCNGPLSDRSPFRPGKPVLCNSALPSPHGREHGWLRCSLDATLRGPPLCCTAFPDRQRGYKGAWCIQAVGGTAKKGGAQARGDSARPRPPLLLPVPSYAAWRLPSSQRAQGAARLLDVLVGLVALLQHLCTGNRGGRPMKSERGQTSQGAEGQQGAGIVARQQRSQQCTACEPASRLHMPTPAAACAGVPGLPCVPGPHLQGPSPCAPQSPPATRQTRRRRPPTARAGTVPASAAACAPRSRRTARRGAGAGGQAVGTGIAGGGVLTLNHVLGMNTVSRQSELEPFEDKVQTCFGPFRHSWSMATLPWQATAGGRPTCTPAPSTAPAMTGKAGIAAPALPLCCWCSSPLSLGSLAARDKFRGVAGG